MDWHLDPQTIFALASDDAPTLGPDVLEAAIHRVERHARRRKAAAERNEQDALLSRLRREMGG